MRSWAFWTAQLLGTKTVKVALEGEQVERRVRRGALMEQLRKAEALERQGMERMLERIVELGEGEVEEVREKERVRKRRKRRREEKRRMEKGNTTGRGGCAVQ